MKTFGLFRVALVLCLVTLLSVALVRATSGFCYFRNDFSECHWTVSAGYGIFYSGSMVLVQQSSDNKSHIEFYQEYAEMEGNVNLTVPASVYCRLSFDADYHQGADGVSGVSVICKNASSDIILMLQVYEDTYHSKFMVLTTGNGGGQTADLEYTLVEDVPDSFIFFTDGIWAILYSSSGDVEASIQITDGGADTFTTLSIETKACDTVEFTEVGVYSSLAMAVSSGGGAMGSVMTSWLPTIVTIAMFAMAIGMVKKMGGRR